MTRKRDAYGSYLIPRGFTLDGDQPSPLRDRWVHPTGVKVDVLPVREFVGLGIRDIRYEWEMTPPDSFRFIGRSRYRAGSAQLGGLRAYIGTLRKDRSPSHSRRSSRAPPRRPGSPRG